ncbi:uncharacterized protein PHACADRAFT_127548 [Phanerochaete carnosa HHB-10118-sp]|uniref:NAD(P)-binding domain-containing protein n=1 Tax=Phanerochaete carnosa (strain HHB-10118-sp) TaxID=650164 RepID=K5UPK6_PHACS|nr:uncharacterized protein PHACADRAFT_127548 [Phanerochaete carnosa HHB-10118-sp]EKM51721.1 hypothetical protein PHACADRAFT_127548 [Phanerochaete carnosa HHB-10118-sp]
MNVYAIGASKNIGYYSALRLLAKGGTVTFLLRKTEVFDADETIQSYVKSGKARLVKGDALEIEDVARGWAEAQPASQTRLVDVLLFTVGGALHHFSIISGAHIFPEDICSAAILNVVRTIPPNQRSPPTQPKLIAFSKIGATKASHQRLPFAMKVFYSWLLTPPHVDKFCMERVAAYCAGMPFPDEGYRPDLLPQGWKTLEGMPAEGAFKSVAILRPGWLTDGPAKADDEQNRGKKVYRTRIGDKEALGYSISRKDVSHFVVEEALERWSGWEGKQISLFY